MNLASRRQAQRQDRQRFGEIPVVERGIERVQKNKIGLQSRRSLSEVAIAVQGLRQQHPVDRNQAGDLR